MNMEPCVAISPGCGDHHGEPSGFDSRGGYTFWTGAPPAEGEMLAPCPFCSCDYADTEEVDGLEVNNTHAPSFWISCNACGAQHHANEEPFPDQVDVGNGRTEYTPEMYVKARAAAVAAWNRRDQRWRTRIETETPA